MSNKITFSPSNLAERWGVHRSSVGRVMARYGCSGLKFGTSRQAARRFTAAEVELVERLAGLSTVTEKRVAGGSQPGASLPCQ